MATGPSDTRTPREECYHALRNQFASGVAAYLKQNPVMLSTKKREAELKANLKALMVLMLDIIKILDRYEITHRSRTARKGDKS